MTRNTDVSGSRAHGPPLEIGTLRRNEARMRRLAEKLPDDLVENLAREVILRVASKGPAPGDAQGGFTGPELRALCLAFLDDDRTAAASMVASLRADGARAEDIYHRHIAGAARMLGDMWTNDEATFAQVTVATGRMFAIMRSMRHLFEPTIPVQDKTAIFASVPGEDHTLGVHMAADIFRKDGWEIALKVGLDHDQLVAEIEKTPSGIVGLSVGGAHSIDALSRLVVALHICCPHTMIVVSGSNVDEVQPILSLMGLDGVASTVDEAKQQLSALWAANMAR